MYPLQLFPLSAELKQLDIRHRDTWNFRIFLDS